MSRDGLRALSALVLPLVLAAATGRADELPVVKGKRIVASVQGEPITLDELRRQVDAARRDRPAGAPPPDGAERQAVLDRLVDTVLIAQEARRMGLDRLPDIRKMVDAQARLMLREELVERVVKDAAADPQKVDELYRASTREWTISAALFENEQDARAMVADLAAGRDFRALASAALAGGKAKKLEDGIVLRREAMDREIAAAVATLAAGATSPVVSTKSGPVVLRVDEIRHRDDPAAKARAEQIVLTSARREAVTAFDAALKKKHVTIDQGLLKAIDYEAERPGIDTYRKDRRVLATITGEPPVTVAELTEELKFQFFHGPAMAAERKRLNARKEQILDGILHRKVFRKEALRLGLDRTDAYRARVREYERSVLFDAVVRKVVAPDLALKDDEIRAFYDEHRAEYTAPEMIRITSLAFASQKAAEGAAESLRTGADLRWVADHADGQVRGNADGVLSFDGRPIMTSELPEGVQKAIAGSRPGDIRLYASPERHVHILVIRDVVPATPRPYAQVRPEVSQRVFAKKLGEAVEEFARKLRALSDVKVYLKSR